VALLKSKVRSQKLKKETGFADLRVGSLGLIVSRFANPVPLHHTSSSSVLIFISVISWFGKLTMTYASNNYFGVQSHGELAEP